MTVDFSFDKMHDYPLIRSSVNDHPAPAEPHVLTDQETGAITRRFAEALLTLDSTALAAVSSETLTWRIPGAGRISGVHSGIPAVIGVSAIIRQRGISVAIEQILPGHDGIAAVLHEVGSRNGLSLDVQVVLVATVENGKVAKLDGFVSDSAAYDRFLA